MGTHYQGTKKEVRALDAFIKLVRAAESVSSRVESHFSRLGITASQFGVLETLFHRGPLYQKDLAKKILKSTGNITMVVDNLEDRGLALRIRDEEDRRHYMVQLTDNGRKLMATYFPEHVERIVQEMGVLSNKEQETLAALCKRVGLQAGAKGSNSTR
jgi:MarR family transcriptional regulator, 2-MHQ and catechol-resistance regulon repressor